MGAKGSKPPTQNTRSTPTTASAPAPAPVPAPPSPKPKFIRISENQIIDPSDPTIFPEKVRNELMAVQAEIPQTKLFLVKEFDATSELIKWLQASKSFFNYEESSENNNNNNTNNNTNRNNETNENETTSEANQEGERQTTAMINRMVNTYKNTTTTKNRSGNETEVDKEVSRLLQAVESTPAPTNALANRLARLRVRKGGNGVERNKDSFMWKLYSMCEGAGIRDQFLANLLETSDRILLAFLNTGHIAGFSIFGPDYSAGSEGCLHRYITCVGPRKLGIGTGIVKEFHAIAKREGYPCVTLGASSAEGFHLKQGYTYSGKKTSEGPEMIYNIPQEGGRKRRKRKTRKQRSSKSV